MEDKKQELLKLIENLDWDKLNEIISCGFVGISREPRFKILIHFLKQQQKEKTIEQKLEDLGFQRWTQPINGLNYIDCGKSINVRLDAHIKEFDIGAGIKWLKNDEKTILKFANYLVNLKNGAINDN